MTKVNKIEYKKRLLTTIQIIVLIFFLFLIIVTLHLYGQKNYNRCINAGVEESVCNELLG